MPPPIASGGTAVVWTVAHRGAVLVAGCLALTTGLWVAGKFEDGWPEDILPWRAPCQLAILWSLVMMALSLLAGTRARMLEPWFGGLDRAVALHRVIGPAAVALLFVHVGLLIPIWSAAGVPTERIFVPFLADRVSVFDVFTIASWGFVAFTALSYAARIHYETWKRLHGAFGLLFVVSAYPSLFMPGSISAFEPLRLWMAMLTFGGTAAIVYRLFFFRRLGPRYRYAAAKTVERGADAYDLVLRPTERRMPYAPGMFVFVSVPGHRDIADDLHPFSLSSSPATRDLRLSVRAIGHFSKALRGIPEGWPVDVYGPFGGLTTHAMADRRTLVWVGAGMGVSPFLGMLSFDATDDDSRRIHLVYVVSDRSQAHYDDLIRGLCSASHSEVTYELWDTATRGRVTAGACVAAFSADAAPGDLGVMLCGSSAFVDDLRRQFHALGVGGEHIIGEGFSFR